MRLDHALGFFLTEVFFGLLAAVEPLSFFSVWPVAVDLFFDLG